MTIPAATTFFAQSIQYPAWQLAACASWQSLVGAETQEASMSRIILVDGGANYEEDQPSNLKAYAIDGSVIQLADGTAWAHVGVAMPGMDANQMIPRSVRRSGSVLIRIAVPRPAGLPAAAWMEFANIIGSIETELLGTFEATTYPAHLSGDIRTEIPEQPSSRSWAKGLMFAHLTMDWRDIP